MANLADLIRRDLALASDLTAALPGTKVAVLVPVPASEISPAERGRMTLVRVVRAGTYRCDLMFDGEAMKAAWTPRVPAGLSRAARAQYFAGRDAFLKDVARMQGIAGAVALLQ